MWLSTSTRHVVQTVPDTIEQSVVVKKKTTSGGASVAASLPFRFFNRHSAKLIPIVSGTPKTACVCAYEQTLDRRTEHVNMADLPPRHVLEQPPEIIEKILSYLSYDEIARLRLVCKSFDQLCQSLLNKGFIAVDRYHSQCLRNVKTQLPRRESERRNHPLARHCDILTAIETRLSLLGMTFMKYVDTNFCCFIPGKVIDEIYRVLRYIQRTTSPPRAHEILQELRDISSMAMEHFDEKIVPVLKQKMVNTPTRLTFSPHGTFNSLSGPSGLFNSSPPRPLPLPRGVRQDLFKLNQNMKQVAVSVAAVKKDVNDYKAKVLEQKKKLQEQEKHILEQNRILAEQNAKISEQESKVNEVNRKLLEYDQAFADLMAELIRSREEGHLRDTSVGHNKNVLRHSTTGVHPLPTAVVVTEWKDDEGTSTFLSPANSETSSPAKITSLTCNVDCEATLQETLTDGGKIATVDDLDRIFGVPAAGSQKRKFVCDDDDNARVDSTEGCSKKVKAGELT